MLIPGYPEGSDITILDTAYIRSRKLDDGKYSKDYLSMTFKDNKDGSKHNHIIYQPKYTYYILKEGYKTDHNLFFIEKEKVEPVECKYSDILKDVAQKTGNLDFFYDNIRNRNRNENSKLHSIMEVFMSDINIEDYYRMLFAREYTNTPCKLYKSYLDIETDGRYAMGDFPEMGEVPINAVSFLDERSNTSYQFLLENDKNPLIAQYKQQLKDPTTIPKLKQFVIDAVGGRKKAIKFGVYDLEYRFLFFNDELEMIQALFELIFQLCPDVLEIWNYNFDLSYIIARIQTLKANPLDIMCDPRIKEKFLKYYYDEERANEFAERGDYVYIAQFTAWFDQMIQFASRRKGRGVFQNYKLDGIGEAVAKVKKLNYSDITTDISMLPYLNYLVFSWYNIMDTIVQKCIEVTTGDMDYIFAKCLVNNTRYSKGHRQSVYLANRFTKDFYDYGYIIGNNTNKWNEKPKEKYPGAQVGDPLHNSTYAVIFINGQPTLLAANVVDFDYKALYPSITLENNMAPNTQIGKFELDEKISYNEHEDMYQSENPDDEDAQFAKYSRGGEFFENMISNNYIEFCKRWLHLGDFKEVVSDIRELFDGVNHQYDVPIDLKPNDVIYFSREEMFNVIEEIDYSYAEGVHNAIFFYDSLPEPAENIISDIRKDAFV